MAIRIDKSVYTPEELATYEALIAKGTVVDPEAGEDGMEGDVPAAPPKKTKTAEVDDMDETKKSANPEESPAIKAALEEMRALKKSYEMDQMTKIAKKYAPLGKKEDELAQTLYDMKKSNEASYNAYIAILDESLGIVEKSGLFSEIGKSAGGASTANSAVEKAEARAKEIMKSDSCDYATAIAKAWIEDPELMDEYDDEYRSRRR